MTNRWRDRHGVVHRVVKNLLYLYERWFIPACHQGDRSIGWKHPKGCPLPVNCMTCLVLEARGG